MFTDPVIVYDPGKDARAYVKVFIDGKRHRFYNGKAFGLRCFPNEYDNPTEKQRLLRTLQYELKKKLEKGWRPGHSEVKQPAACIPLQECVKGILLQIKTEDVSIRYKADVNRIGEKLLDYLRDNGMQKLLLTDTTAHHLESFLQAFGTSGVYYMTQRSNLAGIFTRMVRKGFLSENLVYKTSAKKKVPELNMIFTKSQLQDVLKFLEGYNKSLHLCALLMYGCFLRPHREIRLLKRKHLNEDCTVITLSGSENKSKRIRVVRLPRYVTQEINKCDLHLLGPDDYLLSGSGCHLSQDYLKTCWTRVKRKLLKANLVQPNHTLYSFRHTGAVEVYRKTKDPYKVQQAMFHSSLTVTLVYLRSLGLMTDNNVDDLPDL